jgi:hypothetical protein
MKHAMEADARRWFRGGRFGGLLALVLQLWMLSQGTWSLLHWERSSDFYDAQARAWLHGQWDIDPQTLNVEAFFRGEKAFMYQGPVPALSRLPVVAFTERLDGRLTAVSMLAALCATLCFCLRLGWRLRVMAFGNQRVSVGETICAGVLVFAAIGGSSLLFASSRAWVYHEAIVWSVALSLAAFDFLIEFYQTRRFAPLLWSAFFSLLALSTRASIGLGPVLGLGLTSASLLMDRKHRQVAAGFIAGCGALLAVSTYAAVNYAKFRHPFAVPFADQQFSRVDPARQTLLRTYGSLFNYRFVPTNLLHYWRPDMLGFSPLWPFITLPEREIHVFGNLTYDLLDRTAGIPTTMPFLTLLGIVGLFAVVHGGEQRQYVLLRIPLLAAAAGTVTVLSIGYIANRYQNDFLPPLVLASFLGAPLVFSRLRTLRPRWRRLGFMTLSALFVFGVLSNLALGYVFQRAYASGVRPEYLKNFLTAQVRLTRLLDKAALPVARGDVLPPAGRFGDIFILGDCASVYWSDGMKTNAVRKTNWNGVERTQRTGGISMQMILRRQPKGTREPLVSSRRNLAVVYVEHLGDDRIRIGFVGAGMPHTSMPKPAPYDVPVRISGWLDPKLHVLEVFVDDELYLSTYVSSSPNLRYGVNPSGRFGVNRKFSGRITPLAQEMVLCPQLIDAVEFWKVERFAKPERFLP